MTFFRRLSHLHFFVFYMVLGLGLGGYWWSLRRGAESTCRLTSFLQTSLSGGLKASERWEEASLFSINKIADGYPNPINEDCRTRALKIKAICEQEEKTIKKIADASFPQFQPKRDFSLLAAGIRNLQDSLIILTRPDSATLTSIHALQQTEKDLKILSRVSQIGPESLALLRDNTLLQIRLVRSFILAFLRDQLYVETDKTTVYVPVIRPQDEVLVVGRPFRTELTLSTHSECECISFLVDDHPIAQRNGVAVFFKTFQTTGKHTLKGEVTVRNPLDNTTKTYSKEFQINVFKP